MQSLQRYIILVQVFGCIQTDEYFSQRRSLIEADYKTQIGHDIKLSSKEEEVDKILLEYKKKELDDSLKTGRNLQEKNFILVKDEIEKSDVFKIIKKMPKGAILHIHDGAMGSYGKLMMKWTYDVRCFMCYNSTQGKIYDFKIATEKPTTPKKTECLWVKVIEERMKYGSREEFDKMLMSHVLVTPEDVNIENQNNIWMKFQGVFNLVNGIMLYHEAFEDYCKHSIEEVLDDNIQYIENRAVLPQLYLSNGTYTNGDKDTLKLQIRLQNEIQKIRSDDLFGIRYIKVTHRSLPKAVINDTILRCIDMYEEFPKHFAGFDLVGQEDTGNPLLYYKDELLLPKRLGKKLPYFFHAGETDFQGRAVDENLFDALLLNTSRIGHGFALAKHPYIRDEAKRRNISIELCPISNQVLGLVSDLRDHPAAILMARDQPITISSDDPAIWGASPLSHDFYQVLMAMVPEDAGLKVLKKLALNSIRYSSLDDQGKSDLLTMWKKKWDKFLDDVISSHQSSGSRIITGIPITIFLLLWIPLMFG